MANYTIKAWSNGGPLNLSEPIPSCEARRKASELRDRGFTFITLTDAQTGVEHSFDRFLRENPDV